MAGIIASDYWLVKKQHIDVPALYNPHGRYRYHASGINWRAMVAFLCAVVPNLPGLAHSINANSVIGTGLTHLYTFDWLYGFVSSIVVYTATSLIFPAKNALVSSTVYGFDPDHFGANPELERSDRRGSTGSLKGFGNYGGVDLIGATRKSTDVERRASTAPPYKQSVSEKQM